MNRLFLILLSVGIAIVCFADNQVRTLSVELSPLKGDIVGRTDWDFSQQWIAGDRAHTEISIYGDSLLAETVAGRRAWYFIASDSVRFIGEEDRLTAGWLDSAAYIGHRPLIAGQGI